MDYPSKQKAVRHNVKENLNLGNGKVREAVNAHVQGIMALLTVQGSNPIRIREFWEKLLTHVQSLETMGKLKT